MFLETLRRGLLAHLIKFRFTITVPICLLFVVTTTLIGFSQLREYDNHAS
jgi:hypothetical protein